EGEPGPEVWLRLTVLFGTPLLVASLKVTVTVEAEELSAGTKAGEAITVEVAKLTGPTAKVTLAVFVRTMFSSVTSVAVKTQTPAVGEDTVNVAWPLTSEVPDMRSEERRVGKEA